MELFLTIAITHFIALLTPGADFFLILKTLIQSKQRAAQYTCFGIALGNAIILIGIYVSLFLMGQINTKLLIYMKWLGVAYFAYLAFQCFVAARLARRSIDIIPEELEIQVNNTNLKQLLLGLLSSLLNPKNLMFYMVLVILIYPQYGFIENALVCFWMVGVVLIWNLALVKLLGSTIDLVWLNRKLHYLYYLAGASFIFFMLVLVVS
ncbi:LysE family transporter [Acinetobacter sp. ANC 3882]|uniref:LysE family translocator n=1 Tax=Acinetobacter sp. ANC 3882 TaxID=2923423 RepID=UPI001F4AF996|nr:LysE family transporter [Acinetobacter sp. ANC 3882]MCH7313431.1 LysE family transporter [Acinetobacter sp. ANC 3882]